MHLSDGVKMVAGGLYSSSHSCLLPFSNGAEGSFMFKGSQPHGTTMLVLKCPSSLSCLVESGNIDEAYKIPGEDDYVYFPAIYREHFGLADAEKYSSKTWGW